MLKFDNVYFKYDEDNEPMIDGLSFEVDDGDFISVIGASGCGKSTVFRLINGLEKAQRGSISVDGKNIADIKNYSAYMPQKDLLFPWRTIEKNICMPMEIQKINKTEMHEKACEVLKEVGLYEYRDKYPKDLSGGMKQRASFARTLLSGADLMLLDEPFSALDSITRMGLQEWLLDEWQKHKKTVLFVTHDVEEAIFLSKKIFIITDRPVSHFEECKVPLSYPRNRDDMKRSDIGDMKAMLIKKLRQEAAV
ncbi:MAG: ABC transporter ATP-binding protein [Clostridia bacterium]|jgi:putative hydroxymethylpyrimidine transport system ATP-binding protein|nr:ABC transporter ATP-binding protein [Clostridia bacterium]MCI2015448.1 ABC transporter ATP-binding protein [Clostridia bacterium]